MRALCFVSVAWVWLAEPKYFWFGFFSLLHEKLEEATAKTASWTSWWVEDATVTIYPLCVGHKRWWWGWIMGWAGPSESMLHPILLTVYNIPLVLLFSLVVVISVLFYQTFLIAACRIWTFSPDSPCCPTGIWLQWGQLCELLYGACLLTGTEPNTFCCKTKPKRESWTGR